MYVCMFSYLTGCMNTDRAVIDHYGVAVKMDAFEMVDPMYVDYSLMRLSNLTGPDDWRFALTFEGFPSNNGTFLITFDNSPSEYLYDPNDPVPKEINYTLSGPIDTIRKIRFYATDMFVEYFLEYPLIVKDPPPIELSANWTRNAIQQYLVPHPPAGLSLQIGLAENVFVPPLVTDCEVVWSDGNNSSMKAVSLSYTAPIGVDYSFLGERNKPHPFVRPVWEKEGPFSCDVSCLVTGFAVPSKASLDMLVVEGIAELTITPKYPFSNVNFLAPFDLMITSGQGVTITVDFGDGTAPVSQPAENPYFPRVFNHAYTAAGVYSISVKASNIYQQETTNLTYTVIQKTSYPMQDFNITVVDPTPFGLDPVTMLATMNFHVDVYLAPSPPPGVKILQDCGDGVLNEVPFTSFGLQCSVTKFGLLSVNVQVVLADGTSATFQRQVTVMRPCIQPVVNFPSHQTLASRLQVIRRSPFDITSLIDINCRDLGITYEWRIRDMVYDVNAVGQWKYGTTIQWHNVTNSSVFYFNKNIPIGVYEANITGITEQLSVLSSTSRMYFEVQKGPLTVGIAGGATRELPRDGPLVLDAESLSEDPDELPGNLTFSWSCATLTDVSDRPYLPDVTINTPPLDIVSCFGPPSNYPIGPRGRLELPNGLLADGVWYLFRVVVTKDDRFGVYDQAVRYRADALELEIV